MGDQQGDVYATSEKFAALFEALAADLSIPKQLREVGIENTTQSQHMELLASEAMKQTRLLPNNPRVVTYEDALDLYNKAF
jgi:alcohol dehydrogenase class IV